MYNHLLADFPSLPLALVLVACLIRGGLAQGAEKVYFAPLDRTRVTITNAENGGQNFTQCCLDALRDWRQANGRHEGITIYDSKDPNKIFSTPKDLAESEQQFPCGAQYQDNKDGAATVFITYSYCSSKCGGWQRSHNEHLTEWIQPFVGFILPAAVFCLNVSVSVQTWHQEAEEAP
jgi:hypothetical protein